VQNSRIQNNLLYDNHASGISLFRIDGSAPSTGNVVANNTIVNAADGRWALNIQDGSSGNTVLNNILFSLHSFRGAIDIDSASLVNFVSDHNILEGRFGVDGNVSNSLAEWLAASGGDANSLVVNLQELQALFADYAAADFQLALGSLAIDRGIAQLINGTQHAAPLYDLLQALRPAGAAHDMGAFEIQPVPEPGTWLMLLAGCALILVAAPRRAAVVGTGA